MKLKKTIFTAALAASLAAVVPAAVPADAPVLGAPVCEAAVSYENEGYVLRVPGAYDDVLYTKVFQEDEEGRLFSVTEAKSVAEAWRQNQREAGPGWLFTIGRVSESRLHQMLCGDMSGVEVFAKDAKGNHFIFCHPTDFRMVRRDNEAMARDQKLWSEMNDWANSDVKHDFIADNAGLTKESYDNSNVAMHLAQAAYGNDVEYTISTTQYGPLSPGEVEAAPYVERLICGASYEMTDKNQVPDGEYIVLNFPGENIRFDFFKMGGKENYVREVHEDGYEILYKATFANGTTKAGSVMQQWYNELAAAR